MLSSFKQWFVANQTEITWFLIGMLLAQGAESFSRSDYTNAAILWTFAAANFLTRKIKLT